MLKELQDSPFLHMKQDFAREYIKKFLGEYLSKCKDNKYAVLEFFMKGMVYEKKKLRESYLQEILVAMGDALYRQGIEDYLLRKNLLFDEGERERINHYAWVELSIDQNQLYKPRLFVCTNKGMYIFRSSGQRPCNLCPPENLCPEGPKLEYKYRNEQLFGIFLFPHQK
mmetsp:Transcript_7293/g.5586  ORF Transcript_7293/g.5586 Transcript_7293/m.5586 type:complete len:169 (+) Transcript_7293:2450-2956(+)